MAGAAATHETAFIPEHGGSEMYDLRRIRKHRRAEIARRSGYGMQAKATAGQGHDGEAFINRVLGYGYAAGHYAEPAPAPLREASTGSGRSFDSTQDERPSTLLRMNGGTTSGG
jgi:hypothetical protein